MKKKNLNINDKFSNFFFKYEIKDFVINKLLFQNRLRNKEKEI